MPECDECKQKLKHEVLHTPAGYYIGTFCPNCGPYSRDTCYFQDKETAEALFKSGEWVNYMR